MTTHLFTPPLLERIPPMSWYIAYFPDQLPAQRYPYGRGLERWPSRSLEESVPTCLSTAFQWIVAHIVSLPLWMSEKSILGRALKHRRGLYLTISQRYFIIIVPWWTCNNSFLPYLSLFTVNNSVRPGSWTIKSRFYRLYSTAYSYHFIFHFYWHSHGSK